MSFYISIYDGVSTFQYFATCRVLLQCARSHSAVLMSCNGALNFPGGTSKIKQSIQLSIRPYIKKAELIAQGFIAGYFNNFDLKTNSCVTAVYLVRYAHAVGGVAAGTEDPVARQARAARLAVGLPAFVVRVVPARLARHLVPRPVVVVAAVRRDLSPWCSG